MEASEHTNFDCLRYKETVQRKIYEDTKDMSFAQLSAYLNRGIADDPFWGKLMQNAKA